MSEEYSKIQFPVGALPEGERFPMDEYRLRNYEYYEKLFEGNHFDAFRVKIENDRYGEVYEKLRYVKVNLARLISTVGADMLCSEPPKITVPDGDQEFLDALLSENDFLTQLYESTLSNSYFGDAVFKLRIGKRNSAKPESLIIEDITPTIFFPTVNEFNVRAEPEEIVLAWQFIKNGKKYLRKEIHTPGKIQNKVYLMEGDKVKEEAPLSTVGLNLKPEELTRVNFLLVTHIPNWKTGRKFFGYSDYHDLDELFYAINNRLTKIDNILDTHSDPVLALPEGILDSKGKVKREHLKMFEVPTGEKNAKPEYIVWNASLEAAFDEIDKILESFFMVSEISPDTLGMGKGLSDSGRALKLKLLRTIAKVARKKKYYDGAVKKLLYEAQVLAKEWGITINGKKLQGEPVIPEIKWFDGLPIDEYEQVETEVKRIDAGLTTKKDAIIRIDGVDEDIAEQKVKEIEEENKVDMPKMNFSKNPFSKVENVPDQSRDK